MKARLLHDAGEITEGTEVEIASPAGKNAHTDQGRPVGKGVEPGEQVAQA